MQYKGNVDPTIRSLLCTMNQVRELTEARCASTTEMIRSILLAVRCKRESCCASTFNDVEFSLFIRLCIKRSSLRLSMPSDLHVCTRSACDQVVKQSYFLIYKRRGAGPLVDREEPSSVVTAPESRLLLWASLRPDSR